MVFQYLCLKCGVIFEGEGTSEKAETNSKKENDIGLEEAIRKGLMVTRDRPRNGRGVSMLRANLRNAKQGLREAEKSRDRAGMEYYREHEKVLTDWLIDVAGFERAQEIIEEIEEELK